MSIASMTGFARAEGQHGSTAWVWEIKSVNGRGLDVRCRLPAGYDALEPVIRKAATERFSRGSMTVSLQMTRADAGNGNRINRALLDQLIDLQGELAGRVDPAPPRLDTLLTVRGVVESADTIEDEAERAALDEAIVGSLTRALVRLRDARLAEGARLIEILNDRLAELEHLTGEAETYAAARPEAARERLKAQVDALLEASPALPEERLVHEAAILAAKMDVREELDRLGAHNSAARDLIEDGGTVGRKLDFLCQEFNREANTLCSKSVDAELTRIGLAFKAVIDQLREQVQNIE